MGQNWLICNLYGFGKKKKLIDYDIFKLFWIVTCCIRWFLINFFWHGYIRSQVNILWNKMPHNYTISKKCFQFFLFSNHGITDFFFSRHVVTKLHVVNLFFLTLSKTNFDVICHDVHVCTLHLYEIHWCMHSSRLEPKTSWRTPRF